MPSRSEAQRKLLNAKFGHKWVQAHGFDNKGKLPKRVRRKKTRKGSASAAGSRAWRKMRAEHGRGKS